MLRGSYRNCIYTAYTQQCREGPTETASIQHTRNDAERLLRKLPLHRTHATMPRGSCGNCIYTAYTQFHMDDLQDRASSKNISLGLSSPHTPDWPVTEGPRPTSGYPENPGAVYPRPSVET